MQEQQRTTKMERVTVPLFTVHPGPTGRRYGFVCRVPLYTCTSTGIEFDRPTTQFVKETFELTGLTSLACLVDNKFFVFTNT